jgi:hypothetical protein
MKALEDCASADPGFESCSDADCGGHLTARGGHGRVECSRCGRTPDEVEEDFAPEVDDEDDTDE